MIAESEAGPHRSFWELAAASARLYPQFIDQLQDDSGVHIDFRREGTIRFTDPAEVLMVGRSLSKEDLLRLEPSLEFEAPAVFLEEGSVDPRLLLEALLKSAKHLGVDVLSGAEVTEIEANQRGAVAAVTTKARYHGTVIVNCAGAWADAFSPLPVPTKPIKGQMLALIPEHRGVITHVIRGNGVYLIPRGDGRIVVGATVEDVGFDKRVNPEAIQQMHQAAAVLVPQLGQARIHEDWAGLRPCTPDKLPVIGKTALDGYFVATGHYRDGIMLAPITALLMSRLIRGVDVEFDLSAFSPSRFC